MNTIIASLMLLASCGGSSGGDTPAPVPPAPEPLEKEVRFLAGSWNWGDMPLKLSLNSGTLYDAFLKAEDSSLSGSFSTVITEDGSDKNTFHALAPASAFVSLENGSFVVEIPSVQKDASFVLAGASSASYYGLPDEVLLIFNQLNSYVKLDVEGLPEGEHALSARLTAESAIVGNWVWTLSDGRFLPASEGALSTVSVSASDAGLVFACGPAVFGPASLSLAVTTEKDTYAKDFTLQGSSIAYAGRTLELSFDFGLAPEPEPSEWLVNCASWLDADAAAFLADLSSHVVPAEGDRRILIGKAGDAEEFDSVLAGISHGYVIRLVGDDLVIAGTDDCWTVLAMEAFCNEVISEAKDGTMHLGSDFRIVQSVEDPQMLARLLTAGKEIELSAEQVGYCAGTGNKIVVQGAASDGEHVYFVMRPTDDSQPAVVFKYTLDGFRQVGVSEEFKGYHCNDMTFDTVHDRALVVHGTGDSQGLTAVDAKTLALSEIKTSIGIGGIAYNIPRNIYGITQGGIKYVLASSAFVQTRNFGRKGSNVEGSSDYTAQGMGCDDTYVYFPMSGKSDNILVAYDWNGNYKATLHVPVGIESESMFYAAGSYYVMFDGKSHRAYLYKVIPHIHYGE